MVVTRAYRKDLAGEFFATVRQDRLLYALVAIYAVLGGAYVSNRTGFSLDAYQVYGSLWLKNYLLIFPVALFGAGAVRIILRLDQRRTLAFRHMFSARRMAHFFAGTLLIFALWPFQATFTSIKNTLSINGFLYDRVQADIDKLMHFNTDPWQLLFWLGGQPGVPLHRRGQLHGRLVRTLLRHPILGGRITEYPGGFRVRYIVSFMLVWIVVGNLLAGAYISAGPVYYGHVTGDFARFGEQLALIARNEGHFNAAVNYQNYLWLLH